MSAPAVLIDTRQVAGHTVLQLAINRPDKRNALNADVITGESMPRFAPLPTIRTFSTRPLCSMFFISV